MYRFSLVFVVFILGYYLGNSSDHIYRNALMHYHQDDYGTLMYKCDAVMKEHFIAKAKVAKSKNEDDINNLLSNEISLIDCHHYDVMRKELISKGLTDDDLSLMGLKVMEAKSIDLENLVRIHEIRY
tara:strand:- start:192 stop:572 length:381 start_codon:yes stop_codon:yes gene_type:complete